MKRISWLVVVMVMGLLLAACGGGAPDPVSLTFDGGDDFMFSQTSATVETGAEVTVTLNNTGNLEHSWVLVNDDVVPAEATDADALSGMTTGSIPAGDSSTITFTAPEAGTYQFVCTIAGHAVAGMAGVLTVTGE